MFAEKQMVFQGYFMDNIRKYFKEVSGVCHDYFIKCGGCFKEVSKD